MKINSSQSITSFITRMKFFLPALLLLATASHSEVIIPEFAGWCNPPGWVPRRELDRPRLGLALSGGGLRGLAHIGVLQALDAEGIKVDCIAGVSMGSIIGGLYASGYSAEEILNIALETDWGDIFIDRPSRRSLFLNRKRGHGRHLFQLRFKKWKPYIPPAFTSGQKMNMLLDDLLMRAVYRPEPDFDHLKIPFRAVATDLHSGETLAISGGDMVGALRASAAIPPVFSPVKFEGHILVDGGAVENIPYPPCVE